MELQNFQCQTRQLSFVCIRKKRISQNLLPTHYKVIGIVREINETQGVDKTYPVIKHILPRVSKSWHVKPLID